MSIRCDPGAALDLPRASCPNDVSRPPFMSLIGRRAMTGERAYPEGVRVEMTRRLQTPITRMRHGRSAFSPPGSRLSPPSASLRRCGRASESRRCDPSPDGGSACHPSGSVAAASGTRVIWRLAWKHAQGCSAAPIDGTEGNAMGWYPMGLMLDREARGHRWSSSAQEVFTLRSREAEHAGC